MLMNLIWFFLISSPFAWFFGIFEYYYYVKLEKKYNILKNDQKELEENYNNSLKNIELLKNDNFILVNKMSQKSENNLNSTKIQERETYLNNKELQLKKIEAELERRDRYLVEKEKEKENSINNEIFKIEHQLSIKRHSLRFLEDQVKEIQNKIETFKNFKEEQYLIIKKELNRLERHEKKQLVPNDKWVKEIIKSLRNMGYEKELIEATIYKIVGENDFTHLSNIERDKEILTRAIVYLT